MRITLATLLFPVISLAAGYPPGSYSISGFSTSPTPDELYIPNGFDIEISLKWDGGDTVESLKGSSIWETVAEPGIGGTTLLAFWPEEFSSIYYPDQPPLISDLYIEDGLLAGFHFLHHRHEPIELAADFEAGTYVFDFLWSYQGSRGKLNRAPGYVSDVPEPETLTLLLLGFVAIAVFAGPSGRGVPNRN